MSDRILITPQVMENTARMLLINQANFEAALTRIDDAVVNLSESWQDELFNLANGQYRVNLRNQLVEIPKTLEALADIITDAMNVFADVDDKLRQKIWTTMDVGEAAGMLPPSGGIPAPYPPNVTDEGGTASGDLTNSDTSNLNPVGWVFNDEAYYRHRFHNEGIDCVTFARAVIQDKMGVRLPSLGIPTGYRIPPNNIFSEVAPPISTAGMTSDEVKNAVVNLFNHAQVGDVVQMHWRYGPHTALIHSIDPANKTVTFLHGNADGRGAIKVEPFSFAEFANLVTNGVSVNRLNRFA